MELNESLLCLKITRKPWARYYTLFTPIYAVPTTPDIETVYEFLVLTDRYDALHVVRPWASSWLEVARQSKGSTKADDSIMAMHVAHELGAGDDLHALAVDVARVLSINEDGRLLVRDNVNFGDFLCIGPHDIPSMLILTRLFHRWLISPEMISDMRDKCVQIVFFMLSRIIKEHINAYSRTALNYHNSAFLGAVWHAMVNVRGSLLPATACNITESPKAFTSSLTKVSKRVKTRYRPIVVRRAARLVISRATSVHP